jgi:hypothetical protein
MFIDKVEGLSLLQDIYKYVSDARCTREIKSMAKTVFNKKKALFTSKMDLHVRKKLVKCYTWGIALCMVLKLGHLGKYIRNTLESFEMWCWRRMKKISYTARVRNKEVLHAVKERNIL